ncbi:MAG: N-6 DNA methylase [Nitrospirae bacterium]|nr:N-6 DNA methylase [Nitrospirota bacterium]
MNTLSKGLRRTLENTVKEARSVAEEGARKAIESLAVHHHEPWTGLTLEQRTLRNRLRAHGRQVGDKRDERRGTQAIDRLVSECAYEHWHRMLFARFLAENNLLIEPSTGVAITLQECQELARERSEDWLELASSFAEGMLPQIFRQDDPVLDVTLPQETRSKLESMLEALPSAVFLADDSLGWVYQFWQAEKKDAVNRSEKKIGADELPAVTQLFTEDYMVLFLLHNTLGAWWAGKVLAAKPEMALSAKSEDELRAACAVGDIKWEYLRFIKSPLPQGEGQGEGGVELWRPAAGTFNGWPKAAKDITMLDPCMGSGHFLVFALPILVAFRMAEEGLSEAAAIDAVLRDNLFGLEIDARCTQIAAFNLALASWRRVGYRQLPRLNLACSGLSIGVSKTEWERLAERAAAASPVPPEQNLFETKDNLFSARIREGLLRLYDLFAQAPTLGSLINPRSLGGTLFAADFAQLEPVFSDILRATHTDELAEMAVAAQGMAKAAEILSGQFTLVATNVPYLGRGKQDEMLKEYCERVHPYAKADIATCFVERCHKFCTAGGSASLVTPQNWLFLGSYRKLREALLKTSYLKALGILGPRSFETISGEVVNVVLITFINKLPNLNDVFIGLNANDAINPAAKAEVLISGSMTILTQTDQLRNPDFRITTSPPAIMPSLSNYANVFVGFQNGDSPHWIRGFWEQAIFDTGWDLFHATPEQAGYFEGLDSAIKWDFGSGELASSEQVFVKGREAWGRRGVLCRQTQPWPTSLYIGSLYDQSSSVIVPIEDKLLLPIYCFVSSGDFRISMLSIANAMKFTNSTFVKVPFDLAHWQKVAAEKYPDGLPKPSSDDPTQWIFDGHSKGSLHPLQVAVARLIGYQWPRQTGSSFMDCPALGPDGLEKHADTDGIVCLTPLRGEAPADQRLIALLADAFGAEWSAGKLASLLAEVGFEGKTLDDWLRDDFFEQHCTLFHQRPFIWHIWDGRRDGFHALFNYHKLSSPNREGKRTLETLIYTYLGDWIDRQKADQKVGVEGADGRVAAAMLLKDELENILTGEPPYDIFVRWKPLHKQAIGWEPDINDGVRLNIRPFMTAKPLGARAKGACILRTTPKIKWEKDRGKEPHRSKDDFPWFWSWDGQAQDFTGGRDFDGNRWNDLHYSVAFKQAARARKK